MASEQLQKSLSLLKKSRKYRELMRKKTRQLHLEHLEDRRVMAVTGPTLAVLSTNNGDQLLSDAGVPLVNTVLHTNPSELDFLFSQGQKIDPTTLAGLQLVRAGVDGMIGTGDDVTINPGYVGLLDDPRSVVMRFAAALPDDAYQVTVVGSGLSPLKDQAGKRFNGGVDEVIAFKLNAGAQIQAVVPQPVTRGTNLTNPLQLSQAQDTVTVYFNNDQLNANAGFAGNVKNPAFYQLINASTLNIALPQSVTYSYSAATNTNQAVLKFATSLAAGTYKLQIGSVVSPSNTLATAIHEGGPISGVHAYIGDSPTPGAAQNNDVDLYRFDLAVAGNFSATLTSVDTLNGALRIFNNIGVEIGTVTDVTGAGGIETRTINPLPIGTYYVGISSSGNVGYKTDGTLATGGLTTGAYTLAVSFATPLPSSDQTSFVDASVNSNVGVLGQSGLTINGAISTLPYTLVFPGASDTPGHRDIPDETHLDASPATDTVPVAVLAYNFQDHYGNDPQTGIPLHNAITENQKQRAREILDLYSRYAGIEFVETPASGFVIATGDLRAFDPTIPTGGGVAGLGGGQGALMNAGINWGDSEYGGQWFQVAMHEIGHVIGLGHAYDLPSLTIQGGGETLGALGGEPVFPGDNDILHTQALYRPASRDIDLYKFTLTEAGQWSAETIAEQTRATISTNFNLGSAVTMQFDAVASGAAGDGVQIVFTKSDRGAGANPGITVNLVTRVVSVDLNSNANGTTAQKLIAALSANVAASKLLTAQVTSGSPDTLIATNVTILSLTLRANSSLLDSVLTVYQETQDPQSGVITRTEIARNDDYNGKDSFVNLHLGAGTYYVAVTSKGNTQFDPTVEDTGLGGTTEGIFQLKLKFQADGRFSYVKDISGTSIDGDADGQPGGNYEFDFQAGPTLFVDKLTSYPHTGLLGSITNPYSTIPAALNAAPAALASQGANGVELVRIIGNGGTDGNVLTTADDLPYLVGYNYNGTLLPDSQGLTIPDNNLIVPKGITLMVDAGAILKFRKANIEVGSSAQGVDRSHGAVQVLGTPNLPAWFTAFGNDLLGGDSNGTTAPISGEWGGIVMRADSDYDHQASPIYLNYVNHANMTYGGGKVVVNSVESVYNPLHMVSSRPTLSFNTITKSADAAISADPNSFDDSQGRLGPNLHANVLTGDSLNGLLVRIRTQFGSPVDVLTVNGRFHYTDIVYIVPEDLYINGAPGGPTSNDNGATLIARPSARLRIDPGVLVKLSTSRIEARIGSQLIAEGTVANPIIFTALADNRYGAAGTFSTQNAGNPLPATLVPLGLWSGFYFGPDSKGSFDHVNIFFAGGNSPIEGGFASFSALETYQGDVRIANSLLQFNADGQGPGGGRNGRGSNATTGGASIFVRGAQPIVLNNVFRDNAGQVLSINANAMQAVVQPDYGRSTGLLENFPQFADNQGPLVRLNLLGNNGTNGMEVRGGTLTTATAWDDTDIVHVLRGEVIVPDFHSVGGLTLKSSSSESLVVKSFGPDAGLTASGTMLDINDRIGGSLYVLGQPGHPVVLTSLNDPTVGAGYTPDGLPQLDTNNSGGAAAPPPTGTSGAVIVDGGDRDDHGFADPGPDGQLGTPDDINNDGWQFIQQMMTYTITGARNNAPKDVLALGVTSGQALDAITSVTTVLGLNLTVVVGNQISTVNFADYKVVYVPSNEDNIFGGITQADLDLLALRKTAIQQFVNAGGSLIALTEAQSPTPYAWLELPLAFQITDFTAGGIDFPLRKTQAAINAGFTITDTELSLGVPYHNDFVGPPGFNGLVPFVLDTGDDGIPGNGDDRVITLGLAPGSFGIGIQGGTWRGLKLDQNSNDRNVATVDEKENILSGSTSSHSNPQVAQFIGNLAPDVKSGDDNRKLGFQVEGAISLDNPQNVDVYSFTADSGTEVWIDLDNTSNALQGVLELVDANGNTLARSIVRSPDHDQTLVNHLTGLAADMTKDIQDTAVGPQNLDGYAGRDYYSQNSLDPGFRVVLPGDGLKGTTYFVRVRSQGAADGSQDNDVTKGLTSGQYQLNIRLRQMDEVPGSQIRYSDIRYATIGIDVQGLPLHSLLAGESTNAGNGTSFATAQDLGNLMTADRNAISVSGNLASQTDVQWFSFNIDYDLIQSIGGFSDAAKTWATIFDFDYSDGLARPDATISVFDGTGTLIFTSRDSQVQSDGPAPGQGTDLTDMSRGSVGALDPYIGSAQLPAGTPGGTHRYFVAVSSNRPLPAAMDGTFKLNATSPSLRLEPVDSLQRIIEDHIGTQGGSTAAPPSTAAFPSIGTVAGLAQSVAPYNLSDVKLFVDSGGNLNIVDPYAPGTAINLPVQTGNPIGDITYRSDAVMFGVQDLPFTQNTAGQLVVIDPDTGAVTKIGTDNIPDYDPTANPPDRQQDTTDIITAMAMQGSMYSVSLGAPYDSAIELYYAIPDQFDKTVSRLYRIQPSNGSATPVVGQPWGRVGQVISDGINASGTEDFKTGPVSNVTFVAQNTGALGNGVTINFVKVNDPAKPPALVSTNPAPNILAKTLTIELNTFSQAARRSTNFNIAGISATFTAVAPGTLGNGIQVGFQQASLGAGIPPQVSISGSGASSVITVVLNTTGSPTAAAGGTTLQDLMDAMNGNPAVAAVVSTTIGGTATTDITQFGPNTYVNPVVLANGRDPATAQDVANIFSANPPAGTNGNLAAPLIGSATAGGTNPNGNVTVADTAAYSPLVLTTGVSGIVRDTTGMAFGNNGNLYGVSNSGAFYQINLGSARAINPVMIPGSPSFNGLTRGPQNLYNGAYKDLFFASTSTGLVYAINTAGQIQQVFGAADALDPIPTATSVNMGIGSGTPNNGGLAFSPLDFNLFHPTLTDKAVVGHGLNAAPDNSRTVNVQGGTSFEFSLEKWNPAGDGSTYTLPTGGASNAQYGILTSGYQADLTSSTGFLAPPNYANIANNFNLPGGAQGSMVTQAFSLNGYSATLKPTLYFSYLNDTFAHERVSVSISTDDGASWHTIAGNAEYLNQTKKADANNPFVTDPTDPKPAFISASITDAPANPYQSMQILWDEQTTWRQARIDLSAYAGASNIRLKWNTYGTTDGDAHPRDEHRGFFLDDVIVGFAGRGEMATGASPAVTDFFQTPTPVKERTVLQPPPSEVLNGPYQLEIRRGTEYGATLSGTSPKVTLFDTFDVRDNFVPDDRDVTNDGFETGNFSALPWVNASASPWSVTNTANGTGLLSARAGTASFSPSQTSDLTVTVKTGTGDINFSRKVSSNVGSGVLRFYIDGVLKDQWSGDLSFETFTYAVTPGTHTFRWSYQKDAADSPTIGILDTAWIDDIRFQAPNVDMETGTMPSIFSTHSTPGEINHVYGPPPGTNPPIVFNRQQLGDSPWAVTNTQANTGTFSVKSGNTQPNTTSTLSSVKLTGEGTMQFALRVIGNGTLRFFVDGGLVGNPITATGGWTTLVLNNLTAGYHNFVWVYTTGATVAATDAAYLDDLIFPTPNVGTGTIGDQNQYREQGSIVIEANKVTYSSQIGIAVHPGPRGAGGDLPYPSSVIFGPTLNNSQLVDGVAIFNNVVANSGQTGILFAGDPNNGLPSAAVPFGRIFNNTVYGGDTPNGVGILVKDNAGPTLLNNIVANTVTGISVDASSSRVVNGSPNTVVGTTVYQGNTTNIVFTGIQTNPIVLTATDPLFVNPGEQNFYLANGAKAIDSSVDKLDDRFNYVAVKNPLGIGQSPIIAPVTDLFGQLRQDDPSNDPTGGGQNVFKDVGAVDRVDFEKPTAKLIVPLDNDAAGLDRDPTLDSVLLNNQVVHTFEIQLADVGIGIDDFGVNSNQFKLTADGVPLVNGTDYTFVYDTNKHLALFLPSSGTWATEVKYVFTLDNSAATGITDIAGNTLLANKANGQTTFVIFNGVLYSYGTAPAPYPTLLADDGPQHLIVPGMYLGTFAQPRLDGEPTANPNGDGDGGISNFVFISGLSSHFDVTASIAGKLDVWLDLDKNQVFDVNEHIVISKNIPAGTSTVTFNMPALTSGTTIARFRYSSTGSPLPTGPAINGEVDDYQVTISGAPFQNPGVLKLDVTGDGKISPIDSLRIINLINRYTATFGGNGNIPLPNPFAPAAPDYVDTDGNGVVTAHDALLVVNYLNNPINNPPPNGEGEGSSGTAAASILVAGPTSTADAVSGGGQSAIPAILFGNSSVVVEVKNNTSSQSHQAVDQVFGSGQSPAGDSLQPVLDELLSSSSRQQRVAAKSLESTESEDSWDDLLGDLAADVKSHRES